MSARCLESVGADGPPPSRPRAVFVHGFAGRPAMWSATLDALGPEGAGCALAVLPGHGPMPWFPAGDSFQGALDAMATQLEGRPWLVGYSLGARVALGLALRHPERVAGAVLVGVHPGLDDPRERAERDAWDDSQAEAIERDGLTAFATAWEALPLFDSQRALAPAVREAQRRERVAHTPAGLAWAMRALGLGRMPSYWRALPDAHPPIALVTGALDAKFGALAARAVEASRGAIAHTVVPDAGHNVPLEAPRAMAGVIAAAMAVGS